MKNTQQDHELAQKIAGLLEQGSLQLDTSVADRLLEARKQALARFDQQPERVWAFSWVAEGASRITEPFSYNLRAWAILLALVATLAGAIVWQSTGTQGSEIADIDEALLTSELPINAYLDRSFDSWLKRSSH